MRINPRAIVIETSGRNGEVAIAEGSDIVAIRRLDEARRHARDLAPAVAELLALHQWRARDIELVVVSRGPGSYTGLRVGIMAAKTFAYATGCAIVAVDTFDAIANQIPADVNEVDVLADAQQGKVYVQHFIRQTATTMMQATPLSIQPLADWLATRRDTAWITGPALRTHPIANDVRTVDSERWDPQAQTLLRIANDDFAKGRRDDIYTLEPLYLRASAAEEQWQARSARSDSASLQ